MDKFKIIANVCGEYGFMQALYGLGKSHGVTSGMNFYEFEKNREAIDKMTRVAVKLSGKDGGHNKFLESMVVYIDINAPRYWWQEFDTYRVGVTKQSESTMHTLTKRPVDNDMFEADMHPEQLKIINDMMNNLGKDDGPVLWELKSQLPEGFMQDRLVCTNYKALRGIYAQRVNHRLPHWRKLLETVCNEVAFPDFIWSQK